MSKETWIYKIDDGEEHWFNVESSEKAIEEQCELLGETKGDYIAEMEPEVMRCIPGHVLKVYNEEAETTEEKTIDEWARIADYGFLCSSLA